MPRGSPKKITAVRLDPALLAAVKGFSTNVSQAVEQGLRLWLSRERRKARRDTPAKRRG
jgi:post-segregation antitoxin CcdA